MGGIKAGLVAVLLAAASVATAAEPQRAVVQVYGYKSFIPKGTGSAFFVGPTTLLTANHVAKMGNNLKIRVPSGKQYPAKVIRSGGSQDWAIIQVQGYVSKDWYALDSQFGNSEPVTVHGDFRGDKGRFLTHTGRTTRWGFGMGGHCTARVFPGFSGGPIVDADGEAIGIVSMECPDGSCIFVPVSVVRGLE